MQWFKSLPILHPSTDYKNLSWVWGADWKSVWGSLFGITRFCWVCQTDPEGWIFLYAPNNHDLFFFLHTFWSPTFDLNVGVANNKSISYTLTSAMLKVDVVCYITMTSTSNRYTTSYYNQYTHYYSFLSYSGFSDRRCEHLSMPLMNKLNKTTLVYRNVSKFSDRQVWANSADPDQTAPREEQSDQGLHCLQFPLHLLNALL